jgi:hypothetical protein
LEVLQKLWIRSAQLEHLLTAAICMLRLRAVKAHEMDSKKAREHLVATHRCMRTAKLP